MLGCKGVNYLVLVVPFAFGQQYGSLVLQDFCSKQSLHVSEPSSRQRLSVDVVAVNCWRGTAFLTKICKPQDGSFNIMSLDLNGMAKEKKQKW